MKLESWCNLEREDILYLLFKRREHQEKKYGDGSTRWLASSDRKYVILGEEVGEVGRAILENNPENLVDELLDVLATSFAWLESLEVTDVKTS